ncbi:hypothetical protein [Archangium violaceum]|nr:hypothetical protein [Archangium violaceum]
MDALERAYERISEIGGRVVSLFGPHKMGQSRRGKPRA